MQTYTRNDDYSHDYVYEYLPSFICEEIGRKLIDFQIKLYIKSKFLIENTVL